MKVIKILISFLVFVLTILVVRRLSFFLKDDQQALEKMENIVPSVDKIENLASNELRFIPPDLVSYNIPVIFPALGYTRLSAKDKIWYELMKERGFSCQDDSRRDNISRPEGHFDEGGNRGFIFYCYKIPGYLRSHKVTNRGLEFFERNFSDRTRALYQKERASNIFASGDRVYSFTYFEGSLDSKAEEEVVNDFWTAVQFSGSQEELVEQLKPHLAQRAYEGSDFRIRGSSIPDFSHFREGLEYDVLFSGDQINITIKDKNKLVSGGKIVLYCNKGNGLCLLSVVFKGDARVGGLEGKYFVTPFPLDKLKENSTAYIKHILSLPERRRGFLEQKDFDAVAAFSGDFEKQIMLQKEIANYLDTIELFDEFY